MFVRDHVDTIKKVLISAGVSILLVIYYLKAEKFS